MKRRAVLRASAAAVGGAGATLAGLQVASDDARAQTALTLAIEGDSATLGADETVTALQLAVDVEWAYELPSSAAPHTSIVEIAAGADGAEPVAVDSAESAQLFTSADGSESFDVDLLASEAVLAADLGPSSGERTTDVTIEARLRVEDSEGTALARDVASETAPVTLERESLDAGEYGSVGGSGDLTIEIG